MRRWRRIPRTRTTANRRAHAGSPLHRVFERVEARALGGDQHGHVAGSEELDAALAQDPAKAGGR